MVEVTEARFAPGAGSVLIGDAVDDALRKERLDEIRAAARDVEDLRDATQDLLRPLAGAADGLDAMELQVADTEARAARGAELTADAAELHVGAVRKGYVAGGSVVGGVAGGLISGGWGAAAGTFVGSAIGKVAGAVATWGRRRDIAAARAGIRGVVEGEALQRDREAFARDSNSDDDRPVPVDKGVEIPFS
jgi:hypothetical protein